MEISCILVGDTLDKVQYFLDTQNILICLIFKDTKFDRHQKNCFTLDEEEYCTLYNKLEIRIEHGFLPLPGKGYLSLSERALPTFFKRQYDSQVFRFH